MQNPTESWNLKTHTFILCVIRTIKIKHTYKLFKQLLMSNHIMDNSKYTNICLDYKDLLQTDCKQISTLNEYHCEQVKKLLEECYKFKDKKINQRDAR